MRIKSLFSHKINGLFSAVLLLGLFYADNLQAEGTAQLRPAYTDECCFHIGNHPRNSAIPLPGTAYPQSFAALGCNELNRLNIAIVSPGEVIFFGFGNLRQGRGGFDHNTSFDIAGSALADVRYHLRAPDNTIVQTGLISKVFGAPGFIGGETLADYNRCVAGPQQVVGPAGYNAISHTATQVGQYSLEFSRDGLVGPSGPGSHPDNLFMVHIMDISVASDGGLFNGGAATSTTPGRLWSGQWTLATGALNNPFVADLYAYATDSVVTRIDFNGMRPIGFDISCNSFGVYDTGSPLADRQSVFGRPNPPATFAEFPVFLSPPDPSAFPSGSIGCLNGASVVQCGSTDYCININTLGGGVVDILLDLNGTSGYQTGTQDVYMPQVTVLPGIDCISWDGLDGLGVPVPDGTNIPVRISFYTGLTNLPMFDVEIHSNGYIVDLVRPNTTACGDPIAPPKIYWDDTNLIPFDPGVAEDGYSNLAGCDHTTLPPGEGCHQWRDRGVGSASSECPDPSTGDCIESVNTWWFVNEQELNLNFDVDTSLFEFSTNYAEGPNLGCSFMDGDLIRIGVTFNYGKYWASDLDFDIFDFPPGVSADSITMDSSDLSIPERIVYITYRLNIAGTGVIDSLGFEFRTQTYSPCFSLLSLDRSITCVLPVEWGDINAVPLQDQKAIRLEWETYLESNNLGFDIQVRSEYDDGFKSVGFIPSKHRSGDGARYNYLFEEAEPGVRYYFRLKQRDTGGGKVDYSRVVDASLEAELFKNSRLSVVPNPNNGEFRIDGIRDLGNVKRMSIVDTKGRVLWTKNDSAPEIVRQRLAPGVYLVLIQTDRKLETLKFVVE